MPADIEISSDPSSHPRLPRDRGKFLSHVLTLITGTGIAQVVQVAGTLVIARLCAPEAFGLFALFTTVVSVLSVLGGGRYEVGIMLPESDKEAANIFFLSTIVLLGLAGISAPAFFVLRPSLRHLFGQEGSNLPLWSIPLALFVSGSWQVLGFWFARMKRFRPVAIARVLQTAATATVQIGLLKAHASGGAALIDGWIIGQFVGPLYLVALVVRSDGQFLRRAFDPIMIRQAVRSYIDFPLYKAPYSFVVNAASQLIVIILRMFSSLNAVGLYSLASKTVYMPTSLVASSMNQVFYEKAATEMKSGRIEKFVTNLLRIQAVLGMPLLIFVAFYVKVLFNFIFGPSWTGAGTYASLLAFAGYCYFVSSWLDRIFDVQGRQRLSLILQLVGNLLSLGGLFIALWLTRNTELGVGIFVVSEVLNGIVWLWFVYRVASFDVRGLIDIGKDVLISGSIALVTLGCIKMLLHGWPAILSSIAAIALIEAFYFVRFVNKGRIPISTWKRFRTTEATTTS